MGRGDSNALKWQERVEWSGVDRLRIRICVDILNLLAGGRNFRSFFVCVSMYRYMNDIISHMRTSTCGDVEMDIDRFLMCRCCVFLMTISTTAERKAK